MLRKLYCIANIFMRCTSCIFLLSSVYILIFFGKDCNLGLPYVWGVLLIGLFSALAYIPFLSDREYSKKAMLLLEVLYFLLMDAVVLFVGYRLEWFDFSDKKTIAGMEITIVAVFALVKVITYCFDRNKSNAMNERLRKLQGKR